jgi:hypothetical protein
MHSSVLQQVLSPLGTGDPPVPPIDPPVPVIAMLVRPPVPLIAPLVVATLVRPAVPSFSGAGWESLECVGE